MLRRNWANERSKKWRIVCATTEESHDRESDDGSNSGFTEQSEFHVRCERILWSWILGAALERPTLVDQTSTILSSWTLPRCDSGLPRNTQNCTGIMGNVFERPPVQEGQPSTIFNNSKSIFISGCETWYFRDSKERYEKGIVEYADSIISLPKWKWDWGSYWWNFFSRWNNGSSQSSLLRHGILENSLILWNFKVGSLISRLKFCLRTAEPHSSHYALDQRSWSSEIDWRTFYIAIDCRTR